MSLDRTDADLRSAFRMVALLAFLGPVGFLIGILLSRTDLVVLWAIVVVCVQFGVGFAAWSKAAESISSPRTPLPSPALSALVLEHLPGTATPPPTPPGPRRPRRLP